ncbi:MAG TPA: hypothetical protein VJR06_01910, partial [Nitrososphaerales archaeon]|nr:hypothetical protein [Nitrososphaerales archaeon]
GGALLVLLALVALAAGSPAAAAQNCGIGVVAQPSQVSLPSGSVPPPGAATFGETFDVNYSSSYNNQTMTLQYLNGSDWKGLQNFTGNFVGFSELSYGLDNGWAKQGANSVRVVSGGCASSPAAFEVGFDPGALPVDAAIYAALAALALAFIFLGRGLGWKRFLIVAVPVYLALAPWTGQRYDMYFLISSGMRILQHVNPFDPGSPPAYPSPLKWAYPPIYPLYSGLSFLIYHGLTGTALPSASSLTWPGWLTSTYNVYLAYVPPGLPVLATLLKLPMIASAFLTGALITRLTGKGSSAVWWIANPLVILVAAVWGQLDPIATLLAVASLYCFRQGKEYQAYLLASFGAAVKVWPALIIPIMLVAGVKKGGLSALRPAVAVLPAFLVTLGIYGVFGSVINSLFVLVYARGIPTFAGAFSVNGMTWQEVLFVLKSPPIPLFLYLGLPAYAVSLAWMYFRDDLDVVKWTVVSIMILFLTYNYVNPQYFYWVVPFLLLQERKRASAVFTLLPLMFMGFAYDVFYFVSPAVLSNEYLFGSSVADQ